MFINLEADTHFYLMSDGFVDQGGGNHEFAYGKTRFIKALEQCHHLNCEQQINYLKEALNQYQGDYPQRDDITLLGFKLTASLNQAAAQSMN